MDIERNPGPSVERKNLSMIHINAQSLYMSSVSNPRVKLDEIQSVYAIDKGIDVICVSESWFHDQTDKAKIKITGYGDPYRRDRLDNRYGGVCAYISDNIVSQRRLEFEPPSIELM
jgi:hypothetical protein